MAYTLVYVIIFSYLCSGFYVHMRGIGIAIGVLIVAVVLLSVGVIFRKDHSFRSQHVHENPKMRENNIHCATAQDREAQRTPKNKINIKKL